MWLLLGILSFFQANAASARERPLLHLPLAIETDGSFAKQFSSEVLAREALVRLLDELSVVLERDVGLVASFPYVHLRAPGTGPWRLNGTPEDLLYAFETSWAGHLPQGSVCAVLLTGQALDGGAARVGAVGDPWHAFAVVTGVGGNWTGLEPGDPAGDLFVLAHELGHLLGASHTSELVPPLFPCESGDCSRPGTIMSLCHTCPGGFGSLRLFYHPLTACVMRETAQQAQLQPFLDPCRGLAPETPLEVGLGLSSPFQLSGGEARDLRLEVPAQARLRLTLEGWPPVEGLQFWLEDESGSSLRGVTQPRSGLPSVTWTVRGLHAQGVSLGVYSPVGASCTRLRLRVDSLPPR